MSQRYPHRCEQYGRKGKGRDLIVDAT